MYLSRNWLDSYLPKKINIAEDELKNKISYSLAEVEDVKNLASELTNIFIGQIESIKAHPTNSKLHIVSVDAGKNKKLTVVCGADNIFEQAKVPVAVEGATVYNPEDDFSDQSTIKIKIARIGQVDSQGMLCSLKELGLANDHRGIWILPEDAVVGENLAELIKDQIYEIENKSLTHRADCFSHVGIARELSVILKTVLDIPETPEPLIADEEKDIKIKIENKQLCKRYTAIVIKNVKIKPSPLWLQIKLLSINSRPVNNIVDITNYIMYDLGQPLHAFDYKKIKNNEIIIRSGKKGEKTTSIDNEERTIDKDTLLITDPEKIIAIAGVIGSKNSEITDETDTIVIESANFDMFNIRRTSREFGIRTEAGIRYEKGIDPNLTTLAIKKAAQLITEITGGEVCSQIIDEYPEPVQEYHLEFNMSDVPKLLGIDIPKDLVIQDLELLGIKVENPASASNMLQLTIPTFRADLRIKEDIIEEIARLYGYDKFKGSLLPRTIQPVKRNPEREFEYKIKQLFQFFGFDELYTYSFIDKASYEKTLLDINKCLKLKNPLSSEFEYIRDNLAPSLLSKTFQNLKNFDDFKIFELSKTALSEKDKEGLPAQPAYIAGLIVNDKSPDVQYHEMKGYIEELLNQLKIRNETFEKGEIPKFIDEVISSIVYSGKTNLGYFGALKSEVLFNWDITKNISYFNLDVHSLYQSSSQNIIYKKVIKEPYVRRDISFWIDSKTQCQAILLKLNSAPAKFVKNIEVKDIYYPKDKQTQKSITLTITLQAEDKTLEEKEITGDITSLQKVIKDMKGELRDK